MLRVFLIYFSHFYIFYKLFQELINTNKKSILIMLKLLLKTDLGMTFNILITTKGKTELFWDLKIWLIFLRLNLKNELGQLKYLLDSAEQQKQKKKNEMKVASLMLGVKGTEKGRKKKLVFFI